MRGGLRTKDRMIIAAIMGLLVIIIGGCIFAGYLQNKQFHELAVIAENYLKAGSYEQAIQAYEAALSTKDSDEEYLTIGLAEAYVGIQDYTTALEVLRSYYQKTSGMSVKEKIEEVISKKTDYEYSQSISRAEIYFSNGDYEKAIEVFEEAKKIKSKDPTTYQRIVEAYIKLEDYDLALEEVRSGQVITQDESLVLTLAVVNSYIAQEQYNVLLTQAEEYMLQENYEDGIAKYKEAIKLMPKKMEAYSELAEFYIDREEYEEAIILLQEGTRVAESDILNDLLSQTSEQKDLQEEISSILDTLSKALDKRNTTAVTTILDTVFFEEYVAEDKPVYYGFRESVEAN